MNRSSVPFQNRLLIGLLVFLGLLRLLSLGVYPLGDTTEARYAEIARLMASTGDWIVPQIDLGVPFWGKPPLSTWLSAISFKVLGVHEFSARLPSFLLCVAVIGLVYAWAKHLKGTAYALASVTILATSAVFFISSGAVMTDPALLLGTSLSMIAFHRAIRQEPPSRGIWGYLFFVGLAISLLAKGPVGLVLTFLPVGGWVILQRRWKDTWQRLPWLRGMLLSAALSVPWYLLAERHTPGFLEYFLVGEHWKRFVDAGWQGDLYGRAHSRPRGTIWLFWLASALPWSLIGLGSLFRRNGLHRSFNILNEKPGLTSYLLCWTLAPMLFFSLAGNILWTYVLPGIPAFAMLMAQLWVPSDDANGISLEKTVLRPLVFSRVAIGMTIVFTMTLLIMTSSLVPQRKCQDELVEVYHNLREPEARLVYLYNRPHSAQFYSRGDAIKFDETQEADNLLKDDHRDFFAIRKKHLSRLSADLVLQLENLGEHNGYYLLRELSVKQAGS